MCRYSQKAGNIVFIVSCEVVKVFVNHAFERVNKNERESRRVSEVYFSHLTVKTHRPGRIEPCWMPTIDFSSLPERQIEGVLFVAAKKLLRGLHAVRQRLLLSFH